MSTNNPDLPPDPEDMFNDTRMSIGDHIEDLRTHLLRALKGFVIGMVIGLWPLGPWVVSVIVAPLEDQLQKFEQRKLDKDLSLAKEQRANGTIRTPPIHLDVLMRKRTGDAAPKVLEILTFNMEQMLVDLDVHQYLDKDLRDKGGYDTMEMIIENPDEFNERMMKDASKVRRKSVTTMDITEAFIIYFQISLGTGLVLSSPWVFYHIWAFIAAGLYPHEKKLVHIYMPFSLFLFLAGVLVCEFLVMPRAIEAMLWFNEWLDLDATLRLEEWLSFALLMPVVFGLSFQTPLVMLFAHKIGVVTVEWFREKRRIAWFAMCIFAALITPSVDPVSMLLLWVPMGGLYELGIVMCVYQGGEEEGLAEWEQEEQKSGEIVEV
jgi:sec-independent protein translocase protein TatC